LAAFKGSFDILWRKSVSLDVSSPRVMSAARRFLSP
jgi:hypothetical protein